MSTRGFSDYEVYLDEAENHSLFSDGEPCRHDCSDPSCLVRDSECDEDCHPLFAKPTYDERRKSKRREDA